METNSNSSAENQLQQMVGLEFIKKQFNDYRKALKAHRSGTDGEIFYPHMVLMGNPGTGKTTVARLFAQILHEDGLLPQGQVVEVIPNDLISQYIGQTRAKTQMICDKAKGGVLFIDEAYGLIDFGKEAIEELMLFMENNDDSLVILAGYLKETKRLINEENPGFKKRFNQNLGFFYFEDYTNEELWEILKREINVQDGNYMIDDTCKDTAIDYFASLPRGPHFGNAGIIGGLQSLLISNLTKRDIEATDEQKANPYFAKRILPEDFPLRTSRKSLKEELMFMVNEIQTKLKQLQSKLDELSEK